MLVCHLVSERVTRSVPLHEVLILQPVPRRKAAGGGLTVNRATTDRSTGARASSTAAASVHLEGDGSSTGGQQEPLNNVLLPLLLCSAASTNATASLVSLTGGGADTGGRGGRGGVRGVGNLSSSLIVNTSDYDGRTPLALACAEGHMECIDFLGT